MTLFDILPSLKGVTVTRSFDPSKWNLPIISTGSDICVGELSLREESLRRKIAFFLDGDGQPVCQSLCPTTMQFPALVTRMTAVQIKDRRAVLYVDATLPLTAAIDDVAFPGNELPGSTMADITIVDAARHRRTIHAELPQNVVVTGTIVLALRAVNDLPAPAPKPAPLRAASV